MPEDLHRRILHKLVNAYYGSQLINNVDRGLDSKQEVVLCAARNGLLDDRKYFDGVWEEEIEPRL